MVNRRDILIAIPTRGRVGKTIMLKSIPDSFQQNVVLVPHHSERDMHDYPRVLPAPRSVEGIAATRAWILKTSKIDHRYVMMLDDDMDLCCRSDPRKTKLVTMHSHRRFEHLFYRMLDMYCEWFEEGLIHMGMSPRQGNSFMPKPYYEPHRMMNALIYDRERVIGEAKPTFNRVPVMEDFDLTLKLLRKGYLNRTSYTYCWNQRGSNREGGCSSYRTAEVQRQAALRLKELHPDFVKIKVKRSKTYWKGLEERYDVNIQWVKAYESSNRHS